MKHLFENWREYLKEESQPVDGDDDKNQVSGIIIVRQQQDGSYRTLALLPGKEVTSDDGKSSYQFYGTYDIPKGHAKKGEPTLAAAFREVGEETGYSASDLDFRWGSESFTSSKGKKVGTFFLASVELDPTIVRNPENGMLEHGAFKWITFDEMLKRVGRFWFSDAVRWAKEIVQSETNESTIRQFIRESSVIT